MAGLGAPELIIILVIVMLLFGAAKLPKLARSLGEASKEFKDAIKTGAEETKDVKNAASGDSVSDAKPEAKPSA